MDSSFSLLGICALGTLLFMMVLYKKFRSNPQNITMASPPPPSSRNWGHHVFSSFSSVDVPISFLNRIWKELRRKGFDPLTDNEIERCVSIGPELLKVISVSRIVIVILSRNYASSSWCLDELVEIMKCREVSGQRVVTVFYELDPVDVEKQTGDFGRIFRKTSRPKTKEDTERWSQALAEVATIVGYHSSQWHGDTAAMIEHIATDISKVLNNSTHSSDFQGLVGMEAHMEKMEQMLCLVSNEKKIVGIYGPCGIGKSTIARFLISKHSHLFELSTMTNVKAWAKPSHNEYDAELQLQNQILSRLLNTDEILHLEVAQRSLKDKKVLFVFDGLDSSAQLDALTKETLSFGPGSRIIITTQDPRLLNSLWIQDIYKVESPPPDEALQIFCWYVFGQKSPYDDFVKLAQETTTLSGKYPLGLRFMGSYLRGVSLEYWKNEMPRLRTCLDGEIGSIIKLTYDSLCGEDKELSHHHISCLHDMELNERMEQYLAMGVRKKCIITNQDLKEDIYTSETAFKGMSNRLLHTVYIYCADTLQYSFASHLSMEFRRKGIYAFVNCNETLDVIERVSASVVVFSKSCFSSTSDLDIVRIFHCRRKTNQLVVPVFYGISLSDMVVQEHESADQIREWSSTLHELRELLGHQSRNRKECSERELVEEIVKDVYEKLFPTEQIGINSRLLEIEQLLRKQTWGIRRIGIWGMPGIGKTTLAKAFFDQISGGYEASGFIKHFDKAFHEKGLQCLLEEHFGKVLRQLPRACSSITRPSLPRDKLNKKRTLVVLDDVHNPLVVESFLGGFHWFGPGSLIIIASRDKQVFRLCQINHVYEVQSLNKNEALQLFSHSAFLADMREQNLLKLSMEVIDYANGNPLALSFYGRELKGKKHSELETAFLKLKLRMPYKIYDLFKSSYDTLDDNEKNIFLDIACFFNGENVDYVMRLLEACGFFPHVGIDVLVEKCLVTISENRVKMHRIVQDFGREIINGETVQIERRRRLWEPWAIKFLLEVGEFKANGDPKAAYTHALATEDIEGIALDTSDILFDLNPTAFENMLNLRFLKIYCANDNLSGLRLPKGLESLPYELRLLHWENYPLQSLPQDFDSCHLVELNMSYSQLQKLWEGTKNIDMLRMVSLCHSQQLTQIDDICKAQNIELIDLQGCTKLQSFPATGQLQHLRVVNLSGCREIKSFPEVSPNIEELHLQGTGIRELPISIVTLSGQDKLHRELSNILAEFSGVSSALNLKKLTSQVQIVSSNQHLGKLVSLNMKDCVLLRSLPHLVDLESLKVLNMSGCSKLDDIQGFPRNLKELYLAGTAIKKLPQLPLSIEILNAHGCVSLMSIPFGFEQFPRYYTFSNCFSLSAQVVKKFVENALTNVERITREYQQERNLNKTLAFSLILPSPASKEITFDIQSGASVMIQLGSSWRSTLGFVIFVEVAFSQDYNEASDFGISCVCRWKDRECVSHRLEKNFNCWIPGEGFSKDHMFVFCDLNMHPSSCEGNDHSILADLVVFEFYTVNNQKKFLNESCTVTKCGVYVLTAEKKDTSRNASQSLSSLDYMRQVSDNEVRDVVKVIHDSLDENERNLFFYIACLFNDEGANLLAPLIASNGLGISLGLEVLAQKSLIHLSPYGVIVRQVLLQKIGREIFHQQSTLPERSTMSNGGSENVDNDSTSSLSHNWKYDVFTSFSEEDDCNNKISNLLAEFEGKQISQLKDKMKRSKSVIPELVQAVRESKGSIVVLSKNYASSSRCLDELVEIMNCKKELAQRVVAIFYNVDPSDVRLQIGDFGRAFKTTCIGKSKDEKQKWVRALADLSNITGINSRKGDNEANMIEKSDCHVSRKINHATSKDSSELIRVEEVHVTDISSLSSSESEEVKETFGISVSLEKGEEATSGMVAMPVEPPYWFREEGKLIRSETWSPSFIDRLPYAELYSGEIPAAFLQGLGNIRSMLQSEKSK
ncbi:disease resistance protein RRS1 isoform X2 [Capsella rubella]|uniref:disease resistance protein RRS1 isoform X2 n=1 Tax=Capsella rubella TaxID=81985 RepID=UPI000CD59271|nr:disease resistance protein RRS1 isoform X2 [Capsella rubella]